MNDNSAIAFKNVHKAFGDHQVLKGVNIEVERGTVHFVMGRSGAGKSVLTRQVIGLLRPDSGEVWVQGQEVSQFSEQELMPVRRKCQMIFQHATLFDSMSVLDNVVMPLKKGRGMASSEAKAKALHALERVHVAKHAQSMPPLLGAGVKKRVAIARAIALEPEILLYDEPTTSLDPVAARRTDRLIRAMASELNVTSMVVSHDLTSLRGIADTVTFIEDGIAAFEGSASAMLSSDNPILSSFVGTPGRRWSMPGLSE